MSSDVPRNNQVEQGLTYGSRTTVRRFANAGSRAGEIARQVEIGELLQPDPKVTVVGLARRFSVARFPLQCFEELVAAHTDDPGLAFELEIRCFAAIGRAFERHAVTVGSLADSEEYVRGMISSAFREVVENDRLEPLLVRDFEERRLLRALYLPETKQRVCRALLADPFVVDYRSYWARRLARRDSASRDDVEASVNWHLWDRILKSATPLRHTFDRPCLPLIKSCIRNAALNACREMRRWNSRHRSNCDVREILVERCSWRSLVIEGWNVASLRVELRRMRANSEPQLRRYLDVVHLRAFEHWKLHEIANLHQISTATAFRWYRHGVSMLSDELLGAESPVLIQLC